LITLENWQDIRQRHIGQAEDIKQISRDTGFAVNTVRKYTRSSLPPKRAGAPTRTPLIILTLWAHGAGAGYALNALRLV